MKNKQHIQAFTLLESLVSLSLVSLCTLLLFTAFTRIDNEGDKRERLVSLVEMDRLEVELKTSKENIQQVLDDFSVEIDERDLEFHYELDEEDDNLMFIDVSIVGSKGGTLSQRKIYLSVLHYTSEE